MQHLLPTREINTLSRDPMNGVPRDLTYRGGTLSVSPYVVRDSYHNVQTNVTYILILF